MECKCFCGYYQDFIDPKESVELFLQKNFYLYS